MLSDRGQNTGNRRELEPSGSADVTIVKKGKRNLHGMEYESVRRANDAM